jgi:hypothetical protein
MAPGFHREGLMSRGSGLSGVCIGSVQRRHSSRAFTGFPAAAVVVDLQSSRTCQTLEPTWPKHLHGGRHLGLHLGEDERESHLQWRAGLDQAALPRQVGFGVLKESTWLLEQLVQQFSRHGIGRILDLETVSQIERGLPPPGFDALLGLTRLIGLLACAWVHPSAQRRVRADTPDLLLQRRLCTMTHMRLPLVGPMRHCALAGNTAVPIAIATQKGRMDP